jgi:hypothetical protein
MSFPRYRPLTQNDPNHAILLMTLSALIFTILALTHHEDPEAAPADDTEQFPWPSFLSSSLLSFAGFLWLVLDSWYHGREWWRLLYRSSWYLSGTGMAHVLGLKGLLPIAMGVWGWTGAMGWVVLGGDFGVKGEDQGLGAGPLVEGNDDANWEVAGKEPSCCAAEVA